MAFNPFRSLFLSRLEKQICSLSFTKLITTPLCLFCSQHEFKLQFLQAILFWRVKHIEKHANEYCPGLCLCKTRKRDLSTISFPSVCSRSFQCICVSLYGPSFSSKRKLIHGAGILSPVAITIQLASKVTVRHLLLQVLWIDYVLSVFWSGILFNVYFLMTLL